MVSARVGLRRGYVVETGCGTGFLFDQGYDAYDHSSAAVMTRLEAGYLSELTLLYALQQRRNILVDSSLRHGALIIDQSVNFVLDAVGASLQTYICSIIVSRVTHCVSQGTASSVSLAIVRQVVLPSAAKDP